MARKGPPKKLSRKQIAAVKRHLKRINGGKLPAVGSCRVIGGKPKRVGGIHYGVATICRRGRNRWELL